MSAPFVIGPAREQVRTIDDVMMMVVVVWLPSVPAAVSGPVAISSAYRR
jgi:hypothetical protein